LRKANDKFTKRFNRVEERFQTTGRNLEDATLEELEAEWQSVKAAE
jgi:ATP diphosphatase